MLLVLFGSSLWPSLALSLLSRGLFLFGNEVTFLLPERFKWIVLSDTVKAFVKCHMELWADMASESAQYQGHIPVVEW